MTLAEELAHYLQAQSLGLNFNGVGTINLFVSVIPDVPDNAVAIIQRGGYPPNIWMTGGTALAESPIDNPLVQIRTRTDSQNYQAGDALANAIYNKLQGKTMTYLNGTTNALILLIDALQSPTYLGRDPKQRHEWSQNFRIQWQNPARGG